MDYDAILNRLLQGIPHISDFEKRNMNLFLNDIVSRGSILEYEIPLVCKIIKICNIIYNNAANVQSPVSDDVYDRLIVLCRRQNIDYPIGSPPVQFIMPDEANGLDNENYQEYAQPKEVMSFVDTTMPFFSDLVRNQLPIKENYIYDTNVDGNFKKKRVPTTENNLCGTLDKCKYVLNQDAQADGMFMDPAVSIFERDFLLRHIQMGLVDPNNITLIASLKYDGISVECTIENGTVVSAFTRGDTNNDEAVDLTPVFYGLVFPRCKYMERCNVKFEMIVTDRAMNYIGDEFKKVYVNPRNAVIGLLGGLDARRYRDIITPVPLESDILSIFSNANSRRMAEIEFLNTHFSKAVDLRSVVIHGNFNETLLKLKQYCESADRLRGYMGFWFDGIVVEYADDVIRQRLGKRRAIPNYSIAIKFPPLKAQSTFTHYTYSVGQTGMITPKAHFLPVYFMGQRHDKASVHSFRKVNEFGLRAGDKVNLVFSNDVMVYLTPAPLEEQPKDNPNPVEVFPHKCPACGGKVMISDSGDTAYCVNFCCPERMINRMANFLSKLNVKGFNKETMRILKIHNLRELLNVDIDTAKALLGPENGIKFMDMIHNLLNTEFLDYRIMGAIGFTACGNEVWKKILKHFSIEKILNTSDDLMKGLDGIKGIGAGTIRTIVSERQFLADDIQIILNSFKIKKMQLNQQDLGQVRFTGVRDQQLCDIMNKVGFDANGDGSVTNSTSILIVPMYGYMSGSVEKAFKILNKRLSQVTNGKLMIRGYGDLHLITQYNLYPWIMTPEQAYNYIKNTFGGI